jgi:hypothetical protein
VRHEEKRLSRFVGMDEQQREEECSVSGPAERERRSVMDDL